MEYRRLSPAHAKGSKICRPAGSKCRVLWVARVWPWYKAVAAIKESSQDMLRFLALRSRNKSFHRTRTASLSSSVAGASARRVSVTAIVGSEIESIALVVSRGVTLCTADRAAVKGMESLGLLERWIPLEDLLGALNPPLPIPEAKYSRTAAAPH